MFVDLGESGFVNADIEMLAFLMVILYHIIDTALGIMQNLDNIHLQSSGNPTLQLIMAMERLPLQLLPQFLHLIQLLMVPLVH